MTFQSEQNPDQLGVYLTNAAGLRTFITKLWESPSIADSINRTFYGDGSNALFGCRWIPHFTAASFNSSSKSSIYLSNTQIIMSGSQLASAGFAQIPFRFGSLILPDVYGDYRDLTLVRYKVHIPFLGIIDVPADAFPYIPGMVRRISAELMVDVATGQAFIGVYSGEYGSSRQVLFSGKPFQLGYEIPLRSNGATGFAAVAAAAAIPFIGSVVGAAAGGPAGAAAGAFLGNKAASLIKTDPRTYSTGTLAPNSGLIGDDKCYLITIVKGSTVMDAAYRAVNGRVSGMGGVTIGSTSLTGFVRTTGPVTIASNVLVRHRDKISEIFNQGVYL